MRGLDDVEEEQEQENGGTLARMGEVDYVAGMNQPQPIRVLIRSADGRYLAGSSGCWEFTKDRSRAAVFDYEQDHVPEQIKWLRHVGGTDCKVIRLEPREAYERCDRCGRRLMVIKAFFDGGEYLCPDCREKAGWTRRG